MELAKSRGYEVTAFVRDGKRSKEEVSSMFPGVNIVYGDVLIETDVEKAISSEDATLSTLGVPGNSRLRVVSEGTNNIISAMKKFHVDRLVVESAHGASESAKEVPFPLGFFMRRVLLRGAFEDKDRMEKAIRESGLDWTIVRPTKLTDGPKRGKYRYGEGIRRGLLPEISRADVADFMLNQLESKEFSRKAPTISY